MLRPNWAEVGTTPEMLKIQRSFAVFVLGKAFYAPYEDLSKYVGNLHDLRGRLTPDRPGTIAWRLTTNQHRARTVVIMKIPNIFR